MRLFLDAHISGRRIGKALRELGHNVRSLDQEVALEGAADEELLSIASAEFRILVTMDVADFIRISRKWAEAGRAHSGCAILVGIAKNEFGVAVRALEAAFTSRPDPAAWNDYTAFISRIKSP